MRWRVLLLTAAVAFQFVSVPPPVLVTVMTWSGGLFPRPIEKLTGEGVIPILGLELRFIVTKTICGAFVACPGPAGEPTLIRAV